MAKESTFEQISELVLNLTSLLAYFPLLLRDRVSEVVVYLDYRLHNKLAFAHYVESRSFVSDVVDFASLCQL